MRRIILTEYKGKLLYSLWEEDKPAELALYPLKDGGIPRLGDIYLGRVQDVVQGIRAAFVRLTPECTAYLPLTADTANIKAGDELALQVIKEAHKTKDPVVSNRLSLTGRLAVLTEDEREKKNGRISVSSKFGTLPGGRDQPPSGGTARSRSIRRPIRRSICPQQKRFG